ncbi:UDP-N-acetylmuramoyl-L-alanyl-D-glutamate--2,6-diaminopimelate ligase [Psychrosphaera haliotis]|uniref:UDP-N-acetylmuramoyl-L-alanyl-D-glutamate--2, 6-diaminopimelate ligase n=1 Tax=Psychrosphaera haliotis TaxID=555083 RepID=UPI0031DC908B
MMLTKAEQIIHELNEHLLRNIKQNQTPNKASHESMLSRRLVQDSRQVTKGDIFVALFGHDLNGADFIKSAIDKGADAVLIDAECHLPDDFAPHADVFIKTVQNLRDELAALCQHFYFAQSDVLPVIGITGTNGKTSISHLLAQIADMDSTKLKKQNGCAVIGTMGTGHIDNLVPSNNTTPGITDVYKLLSTFSESNFKAAAMEVSSHALAQGRVAGLDFDIAVFTNLTHEHLDYHGTMDQYFAEKAKLFIDYQPRVAVINVDDSYGEKLGHLVTEPTRLVAYGQSESVPAYSEYVWVKTVECQSYGLHLEIEWQLSGSKETTSLDLPLYGEFNAMNIAAVFATSLLSGWAFDSSAYAKLKPVPGRLELFVEPNQPIAIVDYAHTPDALKASLKAVKEHLSGELTLVFGCGGDRDTSKRPLMAEVAERYADHIIVTNDNPRTEDQETIVQGIMVGFKNPQNISIEYDRKLAIELAVSRANQEDAILIAGKGHEDYQIIGDQKIDYDERAFTAGFMARRASASQLKG